jgi:mannose-1-phosphate guanylyltransferase
VKVEVITELKKVMMMARPEEGNFYAVIMAGGGGTRLWPLSRKERPKQMLQLIDERTLFQTSVERLEGLFPPERILVVTVADQAREFQEQYPRIPEQNYILEPSPRGTASVVGLAAVALRVRDPEAVMAVLTSDHYIGNEERFRSLLRFSLEVALAGHLVTLGIAPTFPSTGFGYIQRGKLLDIFSHQDGQSAESNSPELFAYLVMRFIEKPDQEKAEQMIQSGDHAWNSGMFVWKVDKILSEFQRQMPDLASVLEQIGQAWGTNEQQKLLDRLWPGIKPQTIDYGIMEGAQNVAVIPAEGLDWSDVGSWDTLFDVLPTDENGNIVMGEGHIGLDTHSSLVFSEDEERLIVTIGIEGLVIVETEDVLLVCHKDQAQRVRQVVKMLQKRDQNYI